MSDEKRSIGKHVEAREAAALVDGENYFRAFYHAALKAERYILIAGWQFDLETNLLRGAEAETARYPVRFWSLLRALCERKPLLHVHVVAWDYSVVYALERQCMQALRVRWAAHPRLHWAFRDHPHTIGAHHQKLVVVDDQVAFVGGIDFSESRWDTRRHAARESTRRNRLGVLTKPYHELHAALTGPVVADVTDVFREIWAEARGEELELPAWEGTRGPPAPLEVQLQTEHCPLPTECLALCRTWPETAERSAIREVQACLEHLIRGAEHLIYIETQYFTSSDIERVLLERMRDTSRPQLSIVVVMPNGAESPKEHFVLGRSQDHTLTTLRAAAERHGHELRILYVTKQTDTGESVTCFIHSKLVIVDDRAMTLGSANLTNRSMSFDSELNLAWNLEGRGEPVEAIQNLRSSLLAEHAGRADADAFADAATFIQDVDGELARPDAKLHHLPSNGTPEVDPLWTAVFDPSVELWSQHRHQLRAYDRRTRYQFLLLRWFWTAQLAVLVFLAHRRSRRSSSRESGARPRAEAAESDGAGAEAVESPRRLGLKFVLGLVILYAIVAGLGWAFGDSMQQLGRDFVSLFGLPGFALGTFLADGAHFPVPPQFYMLLTVALGGSAGGPLLAITIGSLLGGAVGFFFARRLSHFRWVSRRIERLRLGRTVGLMERHPYRWALIASITPVAYSWLCYLAGFYRFSTRMFLLLCLLRVPKLLIYFAIIRAGWVNLSL